MKIYCLKCKAVFDTKEYPGFLTEKKHIICLMCGLPIMSFDIDLPKYQEAQIKKLKQK